MRINWKKFLGRIAQGWLFVTICVAMALGWGEIWYGGETGNYGYSMFWVVMQAVVVTALAVVIIWINERIKGE